MHNTKWYLDIPNKEYHLKRKIIKDLIELSGPPTSSHNPILLDEAVQFLLRVVCEKEILPMPDCVFYNKSNWLALSWKEGILIAFTEGQITIHPINLTFSIEGFVFDKNSYCSADLLDALSQLNKKIIESGNFRYPDSHIYIIT